MQTSTMQTDSLPTLGVLSGRQADRPLDNWKRYQVQSRFGLKELPTLEEAELLIEHAERYERERLPPQRILRAWWGFREMIGIG